MNEITKENILKILTNVIEPDLGRSVVELGLVSDINIEGNIISFSVKISSPTMMSKKIVKDACIDSLLKSLGTDIKLRARSGSTTWVRPVCPACRRPWHAASPS